MWKSIKAFKDVRQKKLDELNKKNEKCKKKLEENILKVLKSKISSEMKKFYKQYKNATMIRATIPIRTIIWTELNDLNLNGVFTTDDIIKDYGIYDKIIPYIIPWVDLGFSFSIIEKNKGDKIIGSSVYLVAYVDSDKFEFKTDCSTNARYNLHCDLGGYGDKTYIWIEVKK